MTKQIPVLGICKDMHRHATERENVSSSSPGKQNQEEIEIAFVVRSELTQLQGLSGLKSTGHASRLETEAGVDVAILRQTSFFSGIPPRCRQVLQLIGCGPPTLHRLYFKSTDCRCQPRVQNTIAATPRLGLD